MKLENEKDHLKRIGAAIKLARLRADITGAELAKRIGIFPAIISALENGKSFPGGKMIIALCAALQCSSDELLGLTPPPEKPPDTELMEALSGMIAVLPPKIKREILRSLRK